jgi:DNA-directed RNA polymerase specialized sigma24 family protein
MVAVDGMSVTEAAELLGVKPATARVRLHRSRARLRDHLGDHSLLESVTEAVPVLVTQEAIS